MAVPSPTTYPRIGYPYYYYPIEGTVYDLQVTGDEVLLNTSNGMLRYRIKGMSVKYLRVPSQNIRLIVFALIAIIMGFVAFMFFTITSSPLSVNVGSLFTMFMVLLLLR